MLFLLLLLLSCVALRARPRVFIRRQFWIAFSLESIAGPSRCVLNVVNQPTISQL